MQLKLQKPLLFFDIESTGINPIKDKILEISMLKVDTQGKENMKTWRVHPGIPIPKESTNIHGITDDMVKELPPFSDVAPEIKQWMSDCDLAGYNSNRFDVPMLMEEMYRSNIEIDWEKKRYVDVQTIFFQKEPRTLEAALRFYCNETLENAHSAEADTLATYAILKAQIEKYPDIENDVKFLHTYSSQHSKRADFAGMLVYKEDKICFNFGKYKHQTVQSVLRKDTGYYNWIMNADFAQYTKQIITREYLQSKSAS